MSDAPAIADPLARYWRSPALIRAGLSAMYNDIERAPDEVTLAVALKDALRYVFEKQHSGEVTNLDATHLDELFIVIKERRALYLAGRWQ